MASEVRSGTGNFTYTNSTGQNVRLVINYVQVTPASQNTRGLVMSWSATAGGTTSVTSSLTSIGRNLACTSGSSNLGTNCTSDGSNASSLPTEIMLAAGQTFSLTANSQNTVGAYNIVIIPEAG